MTTKQPNEIELTAERMKEAWHAQRELPRSVNTLPKFDPNTDKTDWVVCAYYVGKHESAPKAKGGKAKKAKPATAEPQEAPEPVEAEEVEA